MESIKDYETLTRREQEIYTLLINGLSKQSIAKKLYLTRSTVQTHIFNIYQKKGFEGRNALQKLICAHYKKLLESLGVQNA